MVTPVKPLKSNGNFLSDSGTGGMISPHCPVAASVRRRRSGDMDGVVIVPRRVEQEVISGALKKASGENLVRKEIENGMSSAAAFQKYGIL